MGRCRNGRYLGAPTHGLIQGFPSTMGGVIRVLGMPIDGLKNTGEGWGGPGTFIPGKTESKRKGLRGSRGGAAALGCLGAAPLLFQGSVRNPKSELFAAGREAAPPGAVVADAGSSPRASLARESTGKAPKALNTCARAAELLWGRQSNSASQLVLQVH